MHKRGRHRQWWKKVRKATAFSMTSVVEGVDKQTSMPGMPIWPGKIHVDIGRI